MNTQTSKTLVKAGTGRTRGPQTASGGSKMPPADVASAHRDVPRACQTVRGINQIIIHERDSQRMLTDACRLLVDTRGYASAWVGLAERDPARLVPAASAGAQLPSLAEMNGRNGASGKDLTSLALLSGQTRRCQDMATDPQFTPWREAATAHGLASAAAVPLVQGSRIMGVLTVYSRQANAFDDEEIQLLQEVAGDLAFALRSIEDQQARCHAEGRLGLIDSALKAAANAIAITDRTGSIQWVNPAFSRLTGYTEAEIIGRQPSVLKSGAHDENFYRELWQTILSGQVWHSEMVNRRKDGSLYAEENTITPVRNEREEITHFITVKQDVSERKRAETQTAAFSVLGERLGQARTAREAAFIIADVADQLLSWDVYVFDAYNPKTDQISQVLGMDLINGRRCECTLPDDQRRPSALARRVIEQGGQMVLRSSPIKAGTDTIPFGDTSRPSASTLYVPVRNGAEMVGLLSIQSYREQAYTKRDLETLQALADHCGGALSRVRSEEELRITGQRFRSIWDRSTDGMRLTDAEGRIIMVNEAYCNLVKMPRDLLEGKPMSVVYERQAPGEGVEVYQDRFRTGQIPAHHRTRTTLWDGRAVDLETSNSFIDMGPQGRTLLSIFRDTSDRRELEEQLRQAQKMEAIGQLAGGVAHDFNNLLAVIRGNAELLLMDGDGISSPGREFLGQINAAAERAANLTRQLLIFSHKQTMQSQPVALNKLVGNMSKMLKRVIREDIQMDCIYGEPLPLVQADPGMLEQVLLNLVVNARDAMPQGGKLQISTRSTRLTAEAAAAHPQAQPGEFVCLSVTDTGEGIAPQILPRIFEPFFTTKGLGKGTGLGLATVYGIAKQHQGWVEVASAVGKGTTFKLFVPALPPQATAPAADNAEEAIPGGTETVLLVEDDYPVRMITRRVLESRGYRVHEASSSYEALQVWHQQAQRIDLLLTDMVMPDGVSGRNLSEQLRGQKPELKVVFMSGYDPDVVGVNADLGRKARSWFIQKPCAAPALLRLVRRCLDEK